MSICIAQITGKYKPVGPWWTGLHWSDQAQNKKIYTNEEAAMEDAYKALKTARRPVVVLNNNDVLLHVKPRMP